MTKSNEAKCFDRTIGGIHQTWMTWQSCMITSNNAQCIVHLPISNLLFRLFYMVDDPNFNATSNKMRKHSNEFNLTRTVWCPTHTKQHPKWLLNILVSVIRIENEKEKKQQRIESNALFFLSCHFRFFWNSLCIIEWHVTNHSRFWIYDWFHLLTFM